MPSEEIKRLLQQTADQAATVNAQESLQRIQERVHLGTDMVKKVTEAHVQPIMDMINAVDGQAGVLVQLLVCEAALAALGRNPGVNPAFAASCLQQVVNIQNFTVDAIVDFAEAELAQQEKPA